MPDEVRVPRYSRPVLTPLPRLARRAALALVAGVLLTPLSACNAKGSGHRTTQSRAVGAFTEIRVEGFVDLEVTQGAVPSLVLEGDDNLLPRVHTDVAAGRLSITTEGSMLTTAAPAARVTAPVSRILAEGSGSLKVSGSSGARLEVELSGSRDATLEGTVDELVLRLSGATKVDARKLTARMVVIDASGASSIELGSPATIDARASGSTRVRYDGSPTVTRDVSGSSSIEPR